MYTLFDEERFTRIHEAALYNEGKADAEKAFAKEKAAYAEEKAAYQSRIAELEARLAMMKA